jgi:hypothetical protein
MPTMGRAVEPMGEATASDLRAGSLESPRNMIQTTGRFGSKMH